MVSFSERLGEIRDAFEESQEARSELINESRRLTKQAKTLIYTLQREEWDKAKEARAALEQEVAKFTADCEAKGFPPSQHGFARAALEEFGEAIVFHDALVEHRLPTGLDLDSEVYLASLMDATGELLRFAVNHAVSDYERFTEIYGMVREIHDELFRFDLPNSDLRRKFDTLKYTIKKLEDIRLEREMKNG